jgi:hypothetical protein
MKPPRDTDLDLGATFFGLFVAFYLAATLFGSVIGYRGALYLLVVYPVLSAALAAVAWVAIGGVGRLTGSLLAPAGTPAVPTFSAEDALIARGDLGAAAESFRTHLSRNPDDIAARMRLASLLSGPVDDRSGAEALLLAGRERDARGKHEWVLTNALIDLHRRAGRDDRLRDELLRLARQFRSTRAGEHARAEAAELIRSTARAPHA